MLLTGGAGYIGSHIARLLEQSGQPVAIVDDLSTGLKSRISGAHYLNLDLSAEAAIERLCDLMSRAQVSSVIHLAAKKQVGESVEKPEEYFSKNLGGQANLLNAMRICGVKKLVFSSSAASYGIPDVDKVSESQRPEPINPYGQTKLIGEWMAANAHIAWGLSHVSLRYFNVAGAGWDDLADTQKLNLIPIVFDKLKNNELPQVYGNDYPTEDGSCIRDYVHVVDLAEAHIKALQYLDSGTEKVFNVGTGTGSSVFEVLNQIRNSTGINFEHQVVNRRAGDPPRLVADVSKINSEMGWSAKYSLEEIVDSAWRAVG